ELLNALEKTLEQIEIEDGLGDGVLGAGLDLELEAVNLLIDVQRAGIGADAEQQRGLRAHRIAADVEPVIQIVHDVRQPDRVDVEDGGRVEVGAHARRITRDADQVAYAGGISAEQLGLDAEDVAVAAAEVIDGLD